MRYHRIQRNHRSSFTTLDSPLISLGINRQEGTFARTRSKESCGEGSLASSGAFGGRNERNKYPDLTPPSSHFLPICPVGWAQSEERRQETWWSVPFRPAFKAQSRAESVDSESGLKKKGVQHIKKVFVQKFLGSSYTVDTNDICLIMQFVNINTSL